MNRFTRTLTLTVATVGMAATAAAATPPSAERMGHDTAAMAQMHAEMRMDAGMQAHMAAVGIDREEMDRWHAAGLSHEQMQARLAARGVDIDVMHAACPNRGHHTDVTADEAGTMHHHAADGHHGRERRGSR